MLKQFLSVSLGVAIAACGVWDARARDCAEANTVVHEGEGVAVLSAVGQPGIEDGPEGTPVFADRRILALVDYLESIQQ